MSRPNLVKTAEIAVALGGCLAGILTVFSALAMSSRRRQLIHNCSRKGCSRGEACRQKAGVCVKRLRLRRTGNSLCCHVRA